MKIIYRLILCLFVHFSWNSIGIAQKMYKSDVVAQKIAANMRDSLGLNGTEYEAILRINLALIEERKELRKRFNNNDTLTKRFKEIEKGLDARYKKVLPPAKYERYLLKKPAVFNIQ